MSAYLVSKKQMILVAFTLECYRKDFYLFEWLKDKAKETTYEINRINALAVTTRYPNLEAEPGHNFRGSDFKDIGSIYDELAAMSFETKFKLVDNLLYQISEIPDWEEIPLCKRLIKLQETIAFDIIRNSKAYLDAPWGL